MQSKFLTKSSFTLIELIVSMMVFSLFMVGITTAYLRLFGAQRDANLARRIYSEARYLMDVMGEEVRKSSIDWKCYSNFFDCGASNFEVLAGPVKVLSLISRDGQRRVKFKVDQASGRLQILRQIWTDLDWQPDTEAGFNSNSFVNFGTENIRVEDVLFYVAPRSDRLNVDQAHADQNHAGKTHLELDEFHYQPRVTMVLGFSGLSPDRLQGLIRFVLQTSVSSRVY